MTKKERFEADRLTIFRHIIDVHIIALIDKARVEGKDRFSCLLDLDEMTEAFEDFLSREEILEDLHQSEILGNLQRHDFPLHHYIPTKICFDMVIKNIESIKNEGFLYLETKLLTLFYTKVMSEDERGKRKLIKTEDVKFGDRIPMLCTYFTFKEGKLVWFIGGEESK